MKLDLLELDLKEVEFNYLKEVGLKGLKEVVVRGVCLIRSSNY